MLDVVKLRELAPGVGRDELLKFGGGLPSEIRAIHEKKHATRPGVFDQTIGERAGGESFACAGGHLNQRTRLIFSKRFFEVGDAFNLAVTHSMRRQWW